MSNIYLNEFDRFVKHRLKPLAYVRYGDDWLCFVPNKVEAGQIRSQSATFLCCELSLTLNLKMDTIQPVASSLSYLGVDIWPSGRRLQPCVHKRVNQRLNSRNAASYRALVAAHEKPKHLKQFDWRLFDEGV